MELEEADPTLVSEDLRLVARIFVFQHTKERVEARAAKQGTVVEVGTRILDGRCRRLLKSRLCLLDANRSLCYPVDNNTDSSGTSNYLEKYGLGWEYQRLSEMGGRGGRGSLMEIAIRRVNLDITIKWEYRYIQLFECRTH
jgi:hypothetical protein